MGGCHGEGKGYLNWDTSVSTIFFSWWKADTPIKFFSSVLVVFILGFLAEGLINIRSQFKSSLNKKVTQLNNQLKLGDKILFSILHTLIVGNGLFLMMIFMTYNGHLMVALVLGHGSGHLFFSEWLPEDPKIERIATCCGN